MGDFHMKMRADFMVSGSTAGEALDELHKRLHTLHDPEIVWVVSIDELSFVRDDE